MTDIDEDKALAALKLGDVLLTNLIEENKRLKAERDDMLEALMSVVSYYKKQGTGRVFCLGYGNDSALEIKLQAAIAKATGKPI